MPVAEQQTARTHPADAFDPDQHRMTVGEHLDELRRRLIYSIVAFFATLIPCMLFSRDLLFPIICAPLLKVLYRYEINPQVYFTGVGDVFFVYMKISLIAALAISGPFLAYQLWQFVAAGLYPAERKVVTRFIPLSISLMLGGFVFMYFVVLPFTLDFFIWFSGRVPMPASIVKGQAVQVDWPEQSRVVLPVIPGDPVDPKPNEIWIDSTSQRVKLFFNGRVRVIQLLPENLTAPMITLPSYVGLVLSLMLVFGVAFQTPLVVMALGRGGIVTVEQLKASRRYVYFGLFVAAAAITPGDVIVLTFLLFLPLILLYELGVRLAGTTRPPGQAHR